ncbi:MAG: cytochrome c peroxidase, partial [Rhizobiaceae bacterium]
MWRKLAWLAFGTALLAVPAVVYLPDWQPRKTVTPIEGFSAPFVFGRFSIPEDNPLSQEAFQLGRHLFYDPLMSGSNVVSCASCHMQKRAFTDGLPRSIGSQGMELEFSSMS